MRLIKLSEVLNITGLSRATVYRFMSKDEFPKSVSLGANSVAWVEGEVEDWILAKVAARDEQ
ncbi:transcriptional regulator [Pseudoalteromonas phenolica]|uniref:Transcriptional regulator n=1 Tax=Pseudoalteromonas phenolica TaxID=161398 RepID=A0A5R9Q2E3_9GAMM|nr:AlpA family transcriptional regulator [Pseudoalteromonas phenolica]TLX47333.1 transcriptional regulator [Pseudoalteromonas phenolica]